MNDTEVEPQVDPAVLRALSEELVAFLKTAHADLSRAELRIADIDISGHRLLENYGYALTNEMRDTFKERIYDITVQQYLGRNGRKFVDVRITMRRGLLI